MICTNEVSDQKFIPTQSTNSVLLSPQTVILSLLSWLLLSEFRVIQFEPVLYEQAPIRS